MIKEIKKEVEVLEAVKVKKEKTVYSTTDGEEFDSLSAAEEHEDLYVRKNMKHGFNSYEVATFENENDLKEHIEDWFHTVDVFDFDYENLIFPNRYVLEENRIVLAEYEDGICNTETHLKIYTKDEYENHVIEEFRKKY